MAEYQDEYVMRDDETLDELLDESKRRTPRRCGSSPRPISTPRCRCRMTCRGFRRTSSTGRSLGRAHLINELARHAGHADIIRESIDGATMYELIAAIEGWPETDWIKPWRPAGNRVARRACNTALRFAFNKRALARTYPQVSQLLTQSCLAET